MLHAKGPWRIWVCPNVHECIWFMQDSIEKDQYQKHFGTKMTLPMDIFKRIKCLLINSVLMTLGIIINKN